MGALERHIKVPNAFESSSVLDVVASFSGPELRERQRRHPFRRDYDALENPMQWPERFDVSNWTIIAAFHEGRRVGGVVCAWSTPAVDLLEGRDDLVILWDVRVSAEAQRQGVGSALFQAAEGWAAAKGCREIRVETQNTNVPACRFYAKQGCHLEEVNHGAYPDLPEETQLIWSKAVEPAGKAARDFRPAPEASG
jgi:GNAT superfamily N-acetyltransferase